MSLDSLLNSYVTLQRIGNTQDSSGGTLKSWSTVPGYEAVPSSVQPLSATDKIRYAQHNIFLTHRIYLAQTLNSQNGDRLLLVGSSRVFKMTGYQDAAGRGRVFYVDVLEQSL